MLRSNLFCGVDFTLWKLLPCATNRELRLISSIRGSKGRFLIKVDRSGVGWMQRKMVKLGMGGGGGQE